MALFAPDGSFIDQNDDGSCPPANFDNFTCFDSTLLVPQQPSGTYFLALTASPNSPAGVSLQDGFTGGADFYGRTPNFAVDVTVQSDISTPEVPAGALVVMGLCGIVLAELLCLVWQRDLI